MSLCAAGCPRRTGSELTMAVPKRKTSRSRTRSRRAQWKATAPNLMPISVAGTKHLVPRALMPAIRRGYLDPETLRVTTGTR